MLIQTALDWRQTLAQLGPVFAERAAAYDESDTFVDENYADLREAKLFSAMVPEEMGGGGLRYSEVCELIRGLGRHCGSTALTFSMHQHPLAAALLNHRRGKPGKALLQTVAQGEKVLAVTGGGDWLSSNGTLERCDGGYRLNAKKPFSSGCLAADLLISSAQFDDRAAGKQVLHFAVPMTAPGIRVERVWETMGMRGTGSHTVVLEDVFIPEEWIALRRPCGAYHPVWDIILTVALPLICAAYVGVAEAAAEKALASARRKTDDGVTPLLIGEMENDLATARIALESMIAGADELEVTPTIETANAAVIRKTIVVEAVKRATDKALEATGGGGYLRASGLERMIRDAQAAQFHPMQAKKQQLFTGRLSLGLDPVAA